MRKFLWLAVSWHCCRRPGRPQAKSSPADRHQHIVVIYEENHSFDNLYGGWEGVDGLPRRRRAHAQVDQAGAPYACLLQNDVNLTSPPLRGDCTDTAHDAHEPLPNAPFRIDDYIAPDGHDVPAAGRVRRQRRAEGHRAARRLHARPRAPLLPGAVPAQRRPAEPLRHGQRRRRPDDGPLRHAQLPIYQYLHAARPPALRDRRPLLPGGVRRLVPQPPVARRRGDAGLRRRADGRRANDLHSHASTRTGCRPSYPLYTADGRR